MLECIESSGLVAFLVAGSTPTTNNTIPTASDDLRRPVRLKATPIIGVAATNNGN
jgi:hypothetical protein